MPNPSDCWGLEIGAHALKAVRLQKTATGVELADFVVIPHKKILSSSDVDIDESIKIALEQFTNAHPIEKSTVVASLAGHQAFARFAKLPPVEPKAIDGIVKFEAVQQIPFPIEQVEWDYQVFAESDSPDVEVGIFAITKDRLIPWLANFQHVDVPIHAVSLSPIAAFNAIRYDLGIDESSAGLILMDIGTSATDLIILDAGRLWMRTIPIGGNHFTDALVRSFKLSFSKAEKLKLEAATSKYARQIFQAMRPVFVDLVQEVQKSLGYYQSLNRDAELERLLGLGSTFRLPGLQTFLKQQLQIEVLRLEKFEQIEASDSRKEQFAEEAITLAPAYGLALQGLGLERVSCNLLPTPIIRQQLWRSKQPWFVAAAAVAFIAAALAGWVYFSEKTRYEASASESGSSVEAILVKANKYLSEWNSAPPQELDPNEISNLYKMMIYRDAWAEISKDVDAAIAAANNHPTKPPSMTLTLEELNMTFVAPEGGGALRTGSDASRPSIQVEITCQVRPYTENIQQFLDQTMLAWLRRESDRTDRELKLVIPRDSLNLRTVQAAPAAAPISPITPDVTPPTPNELGVAAAPGDRVTQPVPTTTSTVSVNEFKIVYRVDLPAADPYLEKLVKQFASTD